MLETAWEDRQLPDSKEITDTQRVSVRLKTKPAGISWVLSFFLDRIYKKWYNKAVS